ncbi:fimbrial protein [Salmonella enterica subsp. enterica]|nr:fimbrial protein [Salmonella enterica subsp. enterica] [Salmonella enterica subsp. enterica serovar Menston]
MSMKKYLATDPQAHFLSPAARWLFLITPSPYQGEVSDETCSVVINGNQAKPRRVITNSKY